MVNWTIYLKERPIIKTRDKLSKNIIKAIGAKLDEFMSFHKDKGSRQRPKRTALIKKTLVDLCGELFKGREVKNNFHNHSKEFDEKYASKYNGSGWLYDLNWYTEKEHYMPTTFSLVVECELQQKRKDYKNIAFSGIKYDFQKLLVTNAELRLMIFIVKKDGDIEELDGYFENAIANYKHLAKNSKFLFIGFDERIRGFHYTEKNKR